MARKQLFDAVPKRISIRLPDHIDLALRIEAAHRRVMPSVIAAEILEAHFEGTDAGRVAKAFPLPVPPKPEKPSKPDKEERRQKHSPKEVHVSDQAAIIAEGYPWTWDRLGEALSTVGGYGQHRELARALGLSNISVWAKTGVPKKWWPGIREFLNSRGWHPKEEQPAFLLPEIEPEP